MQLNLLITKSIHEFMAHKLVTNQMCCCQVKKKKSSFMSIEKIQRFLEYNNHLRLNLTHKEVEREQCFRIDIQ